MAEPTPKIPVTIRLDPGLRDQISEAADADGRSFSNWVERTLLGVLQPPTATGPDGSLDEEIARLARLNRQKISGILPPQPSDETPTWSYVFNGAETADRKPVAKVVPAKREAAPRFKGKNQ